MARGESQTLLIWTIIFLIFSLIMIIVTVVMRSKYTEAAGLLADATSKNQQLEKDVNTLKQDGSKLREMIGHPAADLPVAEIETAFADYLKLYAPTLPQESTSYRTALDKLNDSYKDQLNKNQILNVANIKLTDEVNFNNAKKEELRQELMALVDQARADLKFAQDSHQAQNISWTTTNKKLIEDAEVAINYAKSEADKEAAASSKANQISANVLLINKELTKMVADTDSPVPTYSDAEIIWVSADSTKVIVNLGSKHGLRPRMSFSVYSSDVKNISRTLRKEETNFANAGGTEIREESVNSMKSKIEITKIIDANTAEARVTEDILINPILPGDIIYTPVWKPGQNIHVALMDGIDLDGDGLPDPYKAKALIEMCGGIVDAFIDDLTGETIPENGKEAFLMPVGGAISNETRYLVTGSIADKESPSQSLSDARQTLKNSAIDNGLITITFQDLLALMGQRQPSQTIGFGARNRAINNYEMQPDVVNKQLPGRVFDKYENPDNYGKPGIKPPFASDKVPMSPLFNQRKVTLPSGTVSPLFQPRSAVAKSVEDN